MENNFNQFEIIELNDGELRLVSLDELQQIEKSAIEFDGFTGHINRGSLSTFIESNYIPKNQHQGIWIDGYLAGESNPPL